MLSSMTLPAAAAILSLLAGPVLASPMERRLVSRNPGEFGIYWAHYDYAGICTPGPNGSCDEPAEGFTQDWAAVHSDAAWGCSGNSDNDLDAELNQYCDRAFSVDGRNLKIVSRGAEDCSLNKDNGLPYGTLVEGDKDVGTCSVDMDTSKWVEPCGSAWGQYTFRSRVFCRFF